MNIETTRLETCTVVTVSGRVDSYTAPQLAETLNEALELGHFNIVLDLTAVAFVSSAGLRIMIDVQKTCKKNSGRLLLAGVSPRVYETLELAGFVPFFSFFEGSATAIESLS